MADFKKILASLLVVIFSIFLTNAYGQTSIYKLHSLFLFNFSKHIQWQNVEGQAFTVGVYNNDIALKEVQENLSSKTAWQKPIKVIKVSNPTDASACHILYAPKSNKGKIIDLITAVNKMNTLIVTEEDMIENGAHISFYLKSSRLNFLITKSGTQQAGLKVSTSLYSLGTPVD